jgi:hypothetical protein
MQLLSNPSLMREGLNRISSPKQLANQAIFSRYLLIDERGSTTDLPRTLTP